MLVELNTLKPGETYAKGKYIVRSNDGNEICVRRLSDNWIVCFNKSQINWNKLVEKEK